MSVVIKGTTINMTRGDTLRVLVEIKNTDGTDYIPIEGDSVRFALKSNYNDTSPLLINKPIPINTLILHLEPEDTKDLKMPKTYVYDIELTHANGDVDTFIAAAEFNLTEEVY